jgi:hypothetical protein
VGDDSSFRLAYDEAVRTLRARADTLNGVRQRAGDSPRDEPRRHGLLRRAGGRARRRTELALTLARE